MSEQNKDELARLLGAMAAGHAPSDDEQTDEQTGSIEGHAAPATARPSASSAHPAASSSRPAAPSPIAVQRPRVQPPRRREHLVQTIGFKRTIIPVLLTLGVICPALGLMGFFVSPLSPYAKLAEWWFAIPFVAIGVIMLGLGVLTMFQVRSELAKRRL